MADVPRCSRCGEPMSDVLAGVIACAPGGRQVDVGHAYRCTRPVCREAREQEALTRAIERGVINP